MPKYIVFKPRVTEHQNAIMLNSWAAVEEWLKDGSIEDGDLVFEVTKAWEAIKETKITLRATTDIT